MGQAYGYRPRARTSTTLHLALRLAQGNSLPCADYKIKVLQLALDGKLACHLWIDLY